MILVILKGSRKIETLMKKLRGELDSRKIELREKYDRKLIHLEHDRLKQIEEIKLKRIPEEFEEYEECYALKEEN